jgi:hypothetical protein
MRGARKGEPRAKDWLTSEVKRLCEEWAAGVATEDLAEKYGRTVRAIEVMARDCRARRPKGFNRPTAWQRIEKSFDAAEMQTVDHMILTTGMWKSTILKAIQSHRHLLHVAKWVDSARSDEKVNPFATAAGLIQAPAAANGRVYHHLWDDHDMGEAA